MGEGEGEGEGGRAGFTITTGAFLAGWTFLFLFFQIDWAIHCHIKALRYPLFLLIWVGLVLQLVLATFCFGIEIALHPPPPTVGTPLPLPFYAEQALMAFAESFKLLIVLLISTGWGVIRNGIRSRQWAFVLSFALANGLLVFSEKIIGVSFPFAYKFWGIFYVVVGISTWTFIIKMILTNLRFLQSLSLGSQAVTGDGEYSIYDYLKCFQLYRQFSRLVVIYIIIEFGNEAVKTVVLIMMRGIRPELLYVIMIPQKLLEFGLFCTLCYLFRLRQNNPYFAVPTEEDNSRGISLSADTIPLGSFVDNESSQYEVEQK